MKSSKAAIIVFTRVPMAGYTKSRLSPQLSLVQAAALHSAVLQDVCQAALRTDASVYVFYKPDQKLTILLDVLSNISLEPSNFIAQMGGNLSSDMLNAFKQVFAKGYERVLLVCSDAPSLDSTIMTDSLTELLKYDLVISPALDGGYSLIGLSASFVRFLEVCPAGLPLAIDDIITLVQENSSKRANRSSNCTYLIGQPCPDIDTWPDLEDVCYRSLTGDMKLGIHTASWMKSHAQLFS